MALKSAILVASSIAFTSLAHANNLTASDLAAINQAKQDAEKIVSNPGSVVNIGDIDMSDSYKSVAKSFDLKLSNDDVDALNTKTKSPVACANEQHEDGYLIFVSRSIPESLLKEIFIEASQRQIPIAVIGIKKGENINVDYKHWLSIAEQLKASKKIDVIPSVLIDPKAFQFAGVDQVPAIARFKGKDVSVAYGTVSKPLLDSLDKKEGVRNHKELQGPVFEIVEVDFIHELQRRTSQIDWKKERERAIIDYWKDKGDSFIRLPEATKPDKFWVDLTITANADIKAKNGIYLARKGDEFNPLAGLKLSKKYLIFNPESKKQLEKVSELMESEPQTRFMLIATELNPENGWQELAKLVKKYNQRVFVLTEEMAIRFNLVNVPALVQQDGAYLKVNEFKIN